MRTQKWYSNKNQQNAISLCAIFAWYTSQKCYHPIFVYLRIEALIMAYFKLMPSPRVISMHKIDILMRISIAE